MREVQLSIFVNEFDGPAVLWAHCSMVGRIGHEVLCKILWEYIFGGLLYFHLFLEAYSKRM